MNIKMTGQIKVILGCMYSGKTTEILKEYKRQASIGKKVLCINHKFDNRFGKDNESYICSHDMDKEMCVECVNLNDIDDDVIDSKDVILINEGQFFNDLVLFCMKWCEEKNKNIIVSGLDGNFMREPFGHMLELIPKAESVIKISAFCSICRDGTKAPFSFRVTDEMDEIVIGSSNYIPVCRKHYIELSNKKLK